MIIQARSNLSARNGEGNDDNLKRLIQLSHSGTVPDLLLSKIKGNDQTEQVKEDSHDDEDSLDDGSSIGCISNDQHEGPLLAGTNTKNNQGQGTSNVKVPQLNFNGQGQDLNMPKFNLDNVERQLPQPKESLKSNRSILRRGITNTELSQRLIHQSMKDQGEQSARKEVVAQLSARSRVSGLGSIIQSMRQSNLEQSPFF
mmetsp:Transcript_13142/g.22223  ORF Transcript_13142/g.22223 Transcript_13142/m.22223 type:complete len:200 (-) Transcript_13142:340-939(-)